MDPDKALNERDALKAQLRFHRVMNVGLLVTELCTIGLVGYLLLRDNVKIVPPEVKRPYELGVHYANRDYLTDMAGYVLDRVLTVTPDTVDYNNRVILRMADPSGYGELKSSLEAASLRVKKERISTVWVPKREEVSERSMRVKVIGKLKTYIADKLTSERDKEFIVEFRSTISGRLYVAKVQEVLKSGSAKSGGA